MALHPTPDSDLNAVLRELVDGARVALGANFRAAYLIGSFAVGDWDADSDVDWLIAIERDVAPDELTALQALHAQLYQLPSPWARHLEGSYVPLPILRRTDPAQTPLLFLDNGGRQLERSAHDNEDVVRWVTRECGITLAGPPPVTLIDPVSAAALSREVRATMRTWADDISAGRYRVDNRWAQPFVVLSYCRMLHTLRTGRIGSKPAGARWATDELDARWSGLIQRAWDDRPDPPRKVRMPADPAEVAATLEFMRYAIALSDEWEATGDA
jgi:hypothetical protein